MQSPPGQYGCKRCAPDRAERDVRHFVASVTRASHGRADPLAVMRGCDHDVDDLRTFPIQLGRIALRPYRAHNVQPVGWRVMRRQSSRPNSTKENVMRAFLGITCAAALALTLASGARADE